MTETGNRKVYDQAFKHLAENDPRSLRVMLGALPPDAAAAITRLPKELISSAVIPDELHLIEYRGERRIAHIETRTRSASDVPVACSTTPSASASPPCPTRRGGNWNCTFWFWADSAMMRQRSSPHWGDRP
jgi:hypothetical protein